MEKQTETSKNIIDRRKAVTHSASWLLGVLTGWCAGIPATPPPVDSDLVQVVSTALDRGQTFWSSRIPEWRYARVVLFTNEIETPCGDANSSTGPFYCPADEHIYLDLAFLRAIDGDLGQAYVIAHEIGHHVQNINNGLTVNSYKIELQADCYAGVWMREEMRNNRLEEGDVNEAYFEAAQVGDVGGIDTWTHGDSEHRVAAVKQGLESGKCDI